MADLRYRLMTAQDVGRVPMDCHGDVEVVRERIRDLGAAAVLVFDGEHVGQLQFRRHRSDLRSANGIWHPDYWGDFESRGPPLPAVAASVR